LGDYITCRCYGDFVCNSFRFIIQRIWKVEPNTLHRSQVINPSTMPPIQCPICLEEEQWKNRGISFCFCKKCLQPFHRNCMEIAVSSGHTQCPFCRTDLNSMSIVFSEDKSGEKMNEDNNNEEKAKKEFISNEKAKKDNISEEELRAKWFQEIKNINWDKQVTSTYEPTEFSNLVGQCTMKGIDVETLFINDEYEDVDLPNTVHLPQYNGFEGFDFTSRTINEK